MQAIKTNEETKVDTCSKIGKIEKSTIKEKSRCLLSFLLMFSRRFIIKNSNVKAKNTLKKFHKNFFTKYFLMMFFGIV